MATSTSSVSLQSSSSVRDSTEESPSRDLALKLDKHIEAADFSSAVDFLIFSLGQTDLTHEKETIFTYLFTLLPHHDEKQYTQLCERLPRLLEEARDDSHNQSKLAQQLAERFLALTKELPLEQRIEYFISAQHFIAKAMKMEKDPIAIKKCHQTASRHFVTLIFEFLAKNRAFYDMVDEARRKAQADRVRAHVRQIEDLQRFCCDEEDRKMISELQKQAIEVANARNDELQESFAPLFAMEGQPFSPPTCFSTERYQNALKTFRQQFDILDPRDIRAAQKHHFGAFRTFFKELIDDILAITGPPPCGFDLRAMGSIGREEICPFSDLECMILISEDTLQVRKYFSLFVKILELQMASFGETPGALPFVFTCLNPPEVKGLYLDQSPRKDDRLITTPTNLADLQKELDSEGPTSIQHTVLRTSSLYATDPTLHESYQEESQGVIEASAEDPLKQRALQHIGIRKTDYQEIWTTPFSSATEKIGLKTQFMEPLFHILGDLALYDHVKKTNTLDIIDALGDRFNADSQTLLKEAVSFLYQLRVDIQRFYSEQKDDLYFLPCRTLERVFMADQSIIDSLEKIFYLVIFPLYHVHALTSIHSLDLVNVAMTQVIADPSYTQNPKLLIPLIRQVALHLESTHAPAERHVQCYRKIGEIPKGETLRQTYIDNLKDPSLRAVLAKQPNSAGFRQEKRMHEEAFFASVQAITTSHPVEGRQVQVTAPCIDGTRYLLPSVAEQILDGQGKITSSYESKHSVTSLVWQEHKLHSKMWPSHPLMEYALFDLYYRIAGQLSPANTLARFTITQDDKTIHYPVLISETIDHPTLSKKAAEGDLFSNIDSKQWSWLILCSILTRIGDGRLSNYVMSDHGKIYSVDNDVAFVFPTQENLLFSKINFACVLFFLSKHPMALDPEVLQEFLSLDFDLILSSWLEEVIVKEKEYNSLFARENKPVVLEVPKEDLRSPEKDSFTSSILFPPGAIVACRLQAARLKSAIIRAQEASAPVFCFDLLKEFISLRTDLPLDTKVGERVFRAYTIAQKQSTVATRYATAIGRKAASSLTVAEFRKASFQGSPSQKEIEGATYSPTEALKELLTVVGQVDDQVSNTTSATGRIILQGHFSHLRSTSGPNLMRQELVLKYITHLLESSAIKPTCVTLRDCAVLNRSNLLPFLHPNVKILDLSNSPQITSRSLLDIATMCPQLEELYLCRANIGAFPPTVNFSSAQFPKLRVLQITESPRLTSMQLHAPQLEYLNLSSNPQLETLLFVAHSFPKIVFKNSPMVPLSPIGNLRKMIASESGLCNAVEFYREIFRNLMGDEHVLISNDDDITYFEAIDKNRTSILSSLKKIKETTRQQLLDAASSLHTRLIERLRRLSDVLFPSLPPLEKEWLSICAYLNPDSIPTYFLDEWLKSEHPGENVPEKKDGVLAALSKDQAFIRYDSSTETYSIPGRVQEIVRDKDKHSSYVKVCHLLIRLWDQIDFDDIRGWEKDSAKAEELLMHSDLLMDDPQFKALSSEDQAKFYSNTAETKYIQGKYQEALEKHQRALEIQQKALDPNHPDIANSLGGIGSCLYSQGKYQEALEKFEKALEIKQKSLDPNHPDIAESLNNIGLCLDFQGKTKEAQEKHEQALAIRQKYLEPNHPDIAVSLNNLGLCLDSQGKFQEALEKYEQALAILKKSLPNHPHIASSLNNIGSCLDSQGKTKEAQEKHKQALEIQLKSLDPNHPDIATSLHHIGNCLYSQDKYQEAQEKHEQALEIQLKSLDPNHPDIATSLQRIGNCLYSQGKTKEAQEKHEQALEIQRKSLDSNHPDIAQSLNNIGSCLYSQGKTKEAQEKYEQALEIQLKSLDPNHLDIATSLQRIGNCLYSQGKHKSTDKLKEASEKHAKALEIRQKSLDPNHPDIAMSLHNIGLCLKAQGKGKFQEALETLERALEIRQKSLDPNHPDIAKSFYDIGSCLYSQCKWRTTIEKHQKALEKHQKALEIRQRILDHNHPDIAKSLYRVGECFWGQGKYSEAVEKLERALEIQRKSLDPNHPFIAKRLAFIGSCLYNQGKYQEALEKYQKGLEIRRKSLDPNDPHYAHYIGIFLDDIRRCERKIQKQAKSQG